MTYYAKFEDLSDISCQVQGLDVPGGVWQVWGGCHVVIRFFYQIWFYTILHGLAKFKICFFFGFISLGPKCDTAPSLRTNAAFYSVRCWTDLWHWAVAEGPILWWARKHHWPISLVANVYEREGADVRPVSARAWVSASRWKKKWIRPATTARLIRGDGEGGTRTRSRRTALARAIMALAYQLFNFVHTHFLILFGIPACLK